MTNAMQFLMAQLVQQNQQTQAIMQQLANSTTYSQTPKKPSATFPEWDGQIASVPYFLAKLESYKADPYFSKVQTWSITLPTTAAQSRRVHDGMFKVLPERSLHRFLHNSAYLNDGFKMLADLVGTIKGSHKCVLMLMLMASWRTWYVYIRWGETTLDKSSVQSILD